MLLMLHLSRQVVLDSFLSSDRSKILQVVINFRFRPLLEKMI